MDTYKPLLVVTAATATVIVVSSLIYRMGPSRTLPGRSKARGHFLRRSLASVAAEKGAPQGRLSVNPADYPKIRRDESVVDNLHGFQVADPYRWLEDPDSPETEAYVEAQNKVTEGVLAKCSTRSKFADLMSKLYDYPRYTCPHREGSRYYFSHNTGLQAQSVVYTQASLNDDASVLLDPNLLSKDGTVALMATNFSRDGSLMSYNLSSGGSDWRTIKLKKIDQKTGNAQDLDDELKDVKFSSTAWTHDNLGFFYNKFDVPKEQKGEQGMETDINLNQKLCYHVIGQKQEEDVLVLAEPTHPTWMLSASITDDGRYLLISVTEGCEPTNQLWYVDLGMLPKSDSGALNLKPFDLTDNDPLSRLPLVKLVDNFKASYDYVANVGTTFTFLTNKDAPLYRLVKLDLEEYPSRWNDVIPEHSSDLLQWASALKGDALMVCYLKDVKSDLQLRSLDSGMLVRKIALPGLGSVNGFSSKREDSECFFSFTGFTDPGSIWRLDVAEGLREPTLFRKTQLKGGVQAGDFETRQLFATSKDGTRVPMFVVGKKGFALDGSNPTLLYGYGGFNISLEPAFSVSRLTWMMAYSGIYAVANLRGGGEFGIKWREAGSVHNKQNVFDDFQRPDLYAAVLAQVGVMDMLRFHKFTIGHAWVSDYGSPDNEEDFRYLISYSPIHNVRIPAGEPRQYPAIMVTTGDHDDRVVPLHSHKYTATLQYMLSGLSAQQRNPLVTRIEVRAGHGAGKPTAKIIAEAADMYGFAAEVTGATWKAGAT